MKRMMKLVATVAVAGLALAGCSGSGGESGGSTDSLELWMPPLAIDGQDKTMWENIVEPFEKDKDVKVNVTIIPWDAYETKYLTGITGGSGPDIGYMYSEMLGDYIGNGHVVDLTDKVTDEQKENFLFLDKGVVEDKQYAIPLVVGAARIMGYNKDLLEQAGVEPPTTWEEFIEVGHKLQDAGIKPYTAAWGDPSRGQMNAIFFPFVWQAGGELFAEDGSSTLFDSPEVLEAAKFIMRMKEEGVLSDSATGATPEIADKEFETGQAAFIIGDDKRSSQWTEAGVNWGFIPSLKHKEEGTFIAADQLVMLKQCKDQDLCYDLISFLTSGEQMAKFHESVTFPPIGKDEQSDYPEEFAQMYENKADIMHPLPIVPNSAGTYQVLYKNLQQMLNGQKTPEEALQDAADEANAMLQK